LQKVVERGHVFLSADGWFYERSQLRLTGGQSPFNTNKVHDGTNYRGDIDAQVIYKTPP